MEYMGDGMSYAIRHENGKWLRDIAGYLPAWSVWQNRRQVFAGRLDADRAREKCEFLNAPCKVVKIERAK